MLVHTPARCIVGKVTDLDEEEDSEALIASLLFMTNVVSFGLQKLTVPAGTSETCSHLSVGTGFLLDDERQVVKMQSDIIM